MSLQPLTELPKEPLKIQRALISVSDKSGVDVLADALHKRGVEIISTGGTAEFIKKSGTPVRDVSEITNFPECLDGRVKTLHPYIHAGILARTSHPPDRNQLDELDIKPIELVVVNLYPFANTIKTDNTLETATEYIDIGGPTMVRAAAKNFAHVCVLTSPTDYGTFSSQLKDNGTINFNTRLELAQKAFNHTAGYDADIANYFNSQIEEDLPPRLTLSWPKADTLRYGENPHQKAAVYGNPDEYIDCFHGKKLSYNNYLDVDAALSLMADFEDDDPTCAIFKHTVPCGVATATDLKTAYNKAFSTDTSSPFGGIIIFNKPLDKAAAKEVDKIFTEIIIAPYFTPESQKLLEKKKNRRLIRYKKLVSSTTDFAVKSIFAGALYQQNNAGKIDINTLKTVTERHPTDEELNNLLFAWKVVKHVKSNAIVYARDRQTLGIGTGQTSRVEASQIAIEKARQEGLSLKNCAIASDAFFPFADGVEAAAKAGARAVIQPGGSIRDEEVIKKADECDMAMIFTGQRHFRH